MTLLSSANMVYIRFVSNSLDVGLGFNITYDEIKG